VQRAIRLDIDYISFRFFKEIPLPFSLSLSLSLSRSLSVLNIFFFLMGDLMQLPAGYSYTVAAFLLKESSEGMIFGDHFRSYKLALI